MGRTKSDLGLDITEGCKDEEGDHERLRGVGGIERHPSVQVLCTERMRKEWAYDNDCSGPPGMFRSSPAKLKISVLRKMAQQLG